MSYGRECVACRGGIHAPDTRLHAPYEKVTIIANGTRKTFYIHQECKSRNAHNDHRT